MPSAFSAFFPPPPTFTDADLPSQAGKVFIITGAASGVGFELAKILYSAGGAVHIAARSKSRCEGAIQKIVAEAKIKNEGRLECMVIDLADLRTVKGAAEVFLAKETRLNLLVHNAGVMTPPAGSQDRQGHDLEMGTNCLGPYLLTLFLEPILIRTAAASSALSVRIVWVVSLMQEGTPAGGMSFDSKGRPQILPKPMANYMQSKVGGCWLAAEFAKRLGSKGILSVSLHPGLMRTELQRNMPAVARKIMGVVFKPAIYGAYSELYAGFSPDVKSEHNGGYIMAWGRIVERNHEVANGLKTKEEGGSGGAVAFLRYCDREIKDFL